MATSTPTLDEAGFSRQVLAAHFSGWIADCAYQVTQPASAGLLPSRLCEKPRSAPSGLLAFVLVHIEYLEGGGVMRRHGTGVTEHRALNTEHCWLLGQTGDCSPNGGCLLASIWQDSNHSQPGALLSATGLEIVAKPRTSSGLALRTPNSAFPSPSAARTNWKVCTNREVSLIRYLVQLREFAARPAFISRPSESVPNPAKNVLITTDANSRIASPQRNSLFPMVETTHTCTRRVGPPAGCDALARDGGIRS